MNYLFEKSDSLNTPIECFIFDASLENFPVRPHWHYFCEIIYILEGTARMQYNDDTFLLQEKEMIIFHPRTIHSVMAVDTKPLKYAVLKFDINKFNTELLYAPRLRTIFRQAEEQQMHIFFTAEQTCHLNVPVLFQSCLAEVKNCHYGYNLMLQNYIYILLMNILRHWLTTGLCISMTTAENNYDIDSITEFIDTSMSEELRVSDIAQKCNMSYSNFAKKFQDHYGMSCKEYIERMRIFKVEEYLLFTDHPLSYICQETGFSDCSHLIKSFKHYRGITPKQFKLSHKVSK